MISKKIIGIPLLSKVKMATLSFCFFLIFFISSDVPVISTASVNMMSDIGGHQYYPLLFSLKYTTVAVTCMLCGKLIEKMGRRNILLLGLFIQMITNFTTGLSASILPMLISRTLYGIGQGLSSTAVMIMVAELFAQKSGYGYLITLLGYGAGNVGVPLIAAYLVENYTWRWAFWFLTAFIAIGFILLLFVCPNYRVREEDSSLDKIGVFLSAVTICIIVVVLSFGGGSYIAWSSPITIIMIVVGFASLVLFIRHEKNIDQNIAVFPVAILRSKLIIGCAVGQFAMSVNSTCLYTYIPYYMQMEMGSTPVQAGAAISIISFVTTAMGAMLLIAMVKAQRHSTFALGTVMCQSIAVVLVYIFLSPTLSLTILYALVVFYGLTDSVETYAFTMTVQMGLTTSKIAVGTAIMQFVRQLTGVVATAIATPIINSSASLGAGMKNVFLFAAIITVAGAVVFGIFVPSNKKIKENAAAAQALEDAQQ